MKNDLLAKSNIENTTDIISKEKKGVLEKGKRISKKIIGLFNDKNYSITTRMFFFGMIAGASLIEATMLLCLSIFAINNPFLELNLIMMISGIIITLGMTTWATMLSRRLEPETYKIIKEFTEAKLLGEKNSPDSIIKDIEEHTNVFTPQAIAELETIINKTASEIIVARMIIENSLADAKKLNGEQAKEDVKQIEQALLIFNQENGQYIEELREAKRQLQEEFTKCQEEGWGIALRAKAIKVVNNMRRRKEQIENNSFEALASAELLLEFIREERGGINNRLEIQEELMIEDSKIPLLLPEDDPDKSKK